MAQPDEPAIDRGDEYRKYLDRFESELGACELGTYQKRRGRLIKKLTFDEFSARWAEWQEMSRAYAEIIRNGDTINDVLVRVMRERCDELLLDQKV